MNQRSLRYTDEKSDKFWTIVLDDCCHTVCYGRSGSAGQTQTKEFPTAAAALKSYEKLVAEKLKKGYGNEGAIAIPQPEVVAEKPIKAAKRKAVTVETSIEATDLPLATQTLNYPPARSIDLEEKDWFWNKSRKREGLLREEVQPFDLNAAIVKISKIRTSDHGWKWDWSNIGIPLQQSIEESQFWLMAMTRYRKEMLNYHKTSPHTALGYPQMLTPTIFSQSLHAMIQDSGVIEKLEPILLLEACFSTEAHSYLPAETIIPLMTLFPTLEILKKLQELKTHKSHQISETYENFSKGFKSYILPYLSDVEIHEIRQHLSTLDGNLWPKDYHIPFPWDAYIASYLGWADNADDWISQWEDDRYSHESWSDHYHKPQWIILGLPSVDRISYHMRRLKLNLKTPDYLKAWIAQTHYSELDWVRDSILNAGNKEEAIELMKVFKCVQAPEASPYMLELMLSSKAPQIARQWLDENPDHTIVGLLPTAAGRGKLADAAIEVLRSMKRKGYLDYIQTCLDHESTEIAAKIRSIVIDFEEKEYIPFDTKTTPQWLQESLSELAATTKKGGWIVSSLDLPPIVIGEHRLNHSQVESVLNALRQSKLDSAHPLVLAVKFQADQLTLDTFAWKLFEAWLVEGAPSKENWAMMSIGLLGSDPSALKLAPLIRIYPGENQHQRAVLGLECLRTIGTDTALMQINSIAQKVKFKGIKQRAQDCMEAIAQDREMTRAELEDRIVPDCDLDDRGTRLFDFGPRQFRFILGPDLKPMVKDHENKAKTDLPKPNAKDDPEKAEAAIADWKLLKKQINEIIKLQPDRLEQAMVTGRRWNADEFEMLLVRHPLMTHLVQRIIWGSYDPLGKLLETFRVTEDYTYSNLQDERFEIPEHRQIGLIHPLHIPESLRSAWGEVLSDYEIIQPFIQLGRSLYKLDIDEESTLEITRFNTLKIPIVALVKTLEKLNWQRGALHDHGDYSLHFKYFPAADLTAVVGDYDEVFVDLSVVIGSGLDTIDGCCFLRGMHNALCDYPIHTWMPENTQRIPLGEVDPIIISEVLSDLITVAAKAQ